MRCGRQIQGQVGRTGAPPVAPGASPGEVRAADWREPAAGSYAQLQRARRPLGQAGRLSYPRIRGEVGFTMVEIALSIAVVAFALVAILGVLPMGMTVQKDNRDDGVINQEGRYWLEAIRSGARVEDLTNYVESITITNLTVPKKSVTFDNGYGGSAGLRPQDVIALLSTPKYLLIGGDRETNRVSARVKAITGPAAEKGPLTNEFSFRYEMQVEVTSLTTSMFAGTFPDAGAQARYVSTLNDNLHELRVIMRWPVVQRGNGWFVGNNRKTFRARIAGSYQIETNATPSVANTFRTTLKTNLVVLAPNKFNVDANRTP